MAELRSASERIVALSSCVGGLYPAGGQDWFALQTRARFERKICSQIEGKHHETYVPVTRERRRWTDRYQTVETPLFPGYVFVRAMSDPAHRLAVLQTSGAYGFVTFNGAIARIPDQQISDLRRIEGQNTSWSPYPFLRSGQRIRICGGCLEGLEGIFVAERGRKLVISIEPMERSLAIDIGAYEIEVVGSAKSLPLSGREPSRLAATSGPSYEQSSSLRSRFH